MKSDETKECQVRSSGVLKRDEKGTLFFSVSLLSNPGLRGRLLASPLSRSQNDLELAAAMFQRAIDLDPGFALANAELSVAMLETAAVWDPLRDHQRYQKLIKKYRQGP